MWEFMQLSSGESGRSDARAAECEAWPLFLRRNRDRSQARVHPQLVLVGLVRGGFAFLFLMWPQEREQDYIANRSRISQQHRQTVDTDAFASRRWQSVRKCAALPDRSAR